MPDLFSYITGNFQIPHVFTPVRLRHNHLINCRRFYATFVKFYFIFYLHCLTIIFNSPVVNKRSQTGFWCSLSDVEDFSYYNAGRRWHLVMLLSVYIFFKLTKANSEYNHCVEIQVNKSLCKQRTQKAGGRQVKVKNWYHMKPMKEVVGTFWCWINEL